MSDARTLLRAKRQEARIQHPFAAYTSSGQLRCTACSSSIKSASMWEGHLGSKPHRLAVSRLREAEAAKAQAQALAEQEETRRGKRKAEDADMDVDVDDVPQDSLRVSENTKKRRTSEEPTTTTTSSSTSALKPPKSGFPADFFSDPSQAPVLSTLDSEDESDSEAPYPSTTTNNTTNTNNNNTTQAPSAPKSQLDLEWEAFQASLTASADREEDQKIAYERATVFAEPELAPSAINGGVSGFPPNTGPGTFNNASSEGVGQQGQQGQQEEAGKEEEEEETEEEKRARKEREERELIMDRLIEEERLQEEADERVGLLKARVEALKRAREAKRASKSTNNKS